MNIIIGFVLFVTILLILLVWSESKLGRKHYKRAVSLEEEKKYDEACYYYGLAVLKWSKAKISKEKIRYLWKFHGPFDFAKFLKASAEGCKRTSCDEAGHEITVGMIKEIIEKNLTKQSS